MYYNEVIQCPDLTNITNGLVDTSGGKSYKCTAVYTCNTGFVLNGMTTRTCQGNGAWSGAEPTCDGMQHICTVAPYCTVHVCTVSLY